MRTLLCIIYIAHISTTVLGQDGHKLIIELSLRLDEPTVIGIGQKSATTLQFPHPVAGVVGYGLTDGREEGTYHYAHSKGSRYLSLRNLRPDKDCFLAIMQEEDVYVIHLTPSASPAVLVRLRDDLTPATAREVELTEIKDRRLQYDTERLLNLLKLAANERVLKVALPQAFEGMESKEGEWRYDDGQVATVIRKVLRFPKEDALVLLGEIENRQEQAIQFDPASLQVRVSERAYPVTVVDVAEMIPAKSMVAAHVLIKGDTQGKAAHLSIKNDLRLVMAAYEPYQEPPNDVILETVPRGVDAALFGGGKNPQVKVEAKEGQP